MDSIEFENMSEEDKGKVNNVNKVNSCNDNNIQQINTVNFSEEKDLSEIQFMQRSNQPHAPVPIQPQQQSGMYINNDGDNNVNNEIEFKEIV